MSLCLYSKELPEMMENEVVLNIAEKHSKTAAQVMLRYIVQRDIVVIPKSTNLERVAENIQVYYFTLIIPEKKKVIYCKHLILL